MAIVLGGNLHGHFFGSVTATIFDQTRAGKKACEKEQNKIERKKN